MTIDKWDLKEGHDAIKFMEKMVTDPEIKKVIVVLDRAYAEKADGRKGGVGTETQIISPEIYAKADQDKFVGVASETGDDGKPFLPTFYKSRIYIDLSHRIFTLLILNSFSGGYTTNQPIRRRHSANDQNFSMRMPYSYQQDLVPIAR